MPLDDKIAAARQIDALLKQVLASGGFRLRYRITVDPPLPEGLALGIVWIQYRVENLRILPAIGEGATKVSPRVGHLHVTVDDLPWWWADTSDSNTIDIAGLPVGQHKVRIELVNANHQIFRGQTKIVTFTLPVAIAHEH